MKRYFIYWWASSNISGNQILEFNPKTIKTNELVNALIEDINEQNSSLGVNSLTIKFMMELK